MTIISTPDVNITDLQKTLQGNVTWMPTSTAPKYVQLCFGGMKNNANSTPSCLLMTQTCSCNGSSGDSRFGKFGAQGVFGFLGASVAASFRLEELFRNRITTDFQASILTSRIADFQSRTAFPVSSKNVRAVCDRTAGNRDRKLRE